MSNRFNLIDEPWIPIANHGLVSIREVFANKAFGTLGGTPVEKICLFKLLMAIAQAAATPTDEHDWKAMGVDGMAASVLDYLERWHDQFYLFGDKPFLQFPQIKAAKDQLYGTACYGIAVGNTTVLNNFQLPGPLSDAQKALVLITQISMPMGGSRVNKDIVLTPGYTGKLNNKGKVANAKPGCSLGDFGYLHTYLFGESLLETLWLNLITHECIAQIPMYASGIGKAPWEEMPTGEACVIAQALKTSLIGRLIPLSRFCLLGNDMIKLIEGIAHSTYCEGMVDPTVTVSYAAKNPMVLWVDPEKRPWRELVAVLSFVDNTQTSQFQTLQVEVAIKRVHHLQGAFGIWSGGVKVTKNKTEQYLSGSDDYVASSLWLHKDLLGDIGFHHMKSEMQAMDKIAGMMANSVEKFFLEQNMPPKEANSAKANSAKANSAKAKATLLFWQYAEREFQGLIQACETCESSVDEIRGIRRLIIEHAHTVYNYVCTRQTARQIQIWAKNRPRLGIFMQG